MKTKHFFKSVFCKLDFASKVFPYLVFCFSLTLVFFKPCWFLLVLFFNYGQIIISTNHCFWCICISHCFQFCPNQGLFAHFGLCMAFWTFRSRSNSFGLEKNRHMLLFLIWPHLVSFFFCLFSTLQGTFVFGVRFKVQKLCCYLLM